MIFDERDMLSSEPLPVDPPSRAWTFLAGLVVAALLMLAALS